MLMLTHTSVGIHTWNLASTVGQQGCFKCEQLNNTFFCWHIQMSAGLEHRWTVGEQEKQHCGCKIWTGTSRELKRERCIYQWECDRGRRPEFISKRHYIYMYIWSWMASEWAALGAETQGSCRGPWTWMGKEAAGWKDKLSSQKQRASNGKVFPFFSLFWTKTALITLWLPYTDLQFKTQVKGFSLINNFNGFFFFHPLKLVNGKVCDS